MFGSSGSAARTESTAVALTPLFAPVTLIVVTPALSAVAFTLIPLVASSDAILALATVHENPYRPDQMGSR